MRVPFSLSCPQCDASLKIKDESLLGARVKCPKCGERFTADEPVEVIEEPEVLDDEFDDAGDLPPLPKSRNKPKCADSNSPGTKTFLPPTHLGSGGGRKSKQQLRIALVGGGVVLIAGVVVAGVLFARAGSAAPARFDPPTKYVPIRPGSIPLTGVIPEGWRENYGGGVGAVPIRASFSDGGSISIEIRQTVGISILVRQAIAGKRPEPPTLQELHKHHGSMIRKDMARLEDDSAQPIEMEGFPEACVSNFTGKEMGIFGAEVQGCRATLRGRKRQFNVVCKCPPAQFDDVRPVFEKIIASLGTLETK